MADDVVVRIGGQAQGLLDALGQALVGFQGLGSGILKALAGPAVILGGIGALALKAASDVREAQNTIRVATGATGDDLARLMETFRQVYKQVPDSAALVAQALGDLHARTGETGSQLEALAIQELNLARIHKQDLGPMIEATTRLFKSWSIATDQQAGSLDFLHKVSQATGIDVTGLAENLVKFGPILRTLGYSFEEGATLLGKWEKEGVNLGSALAGLKYAMGQFAKSGEEPRAALERIISEIKNAKTESDATGIAVQTFGRRAGVELARAILEGRLGIDDLLKSLRASPETVNQATEATKTLGERFTEMRHEVETALEPLGKGLYTAIKTIALPVLRELVDLLVEVIGTINTVVEKWQALPEPVRVATEGVALFTVALWALNTAFAAAALGAVVGFIAKLGAILVAASDVGMALVGGGGVTAALGALVTPAGVAAAAIVALTAALYAGSIAWDIYKNHQQQGKDDAEAAARAQRMMAEASTIVGHAVTSEADAIAILDAHAKALRATYQETAKGAADAGAAHDALADRIAKVRAEVANLSSAERQEIVTALATGISASEIAKQMGISAEAIELVKKAHEAAWAAAKQHAEAFQNLKAKSAEMVTEFDNLVRRGVPVEEIWKAMHSGVEGMTGDFAKFDAAVPPEMARVQAAIKGMSDEARRTESYDQLVVKGTDLVRAFDGMVARGIPAKEIFRDLGGGAASLRGEFAKVDAEMTPAMARVVAALSDMGKQVKTEETLEALKTRATDLVTAFQDLATSGMPPAEIFKLLGSQAESFNAAFAKLKTDIPADVQVVMDALKRIGEGIKIDKAVADNEALIEQANRDIEAAQGDSLGRQVAAVNKRYDAEARRVKEGVGNSLEALATIEQAREAALYKLTSFWGPVIEAAKTAWSAIKTDVSMNLAQMLSGTETFRQGVTNIWTSIKKAFDDVLAAMIKSFMEKFILGLLAQLNGQKGALGAALAGMFSTAGAGGGGGLNLGALLGTGIPTAAGTAGAAGSVAAGSVGNFVETEGAGVGSVLASGKTGTASGGLSAGGAIGGAAAGAIVGGTVGYESGSKAKGALAGAATGASIGMVAGPWGAAIGAAVGAIAGLIGGITGAQAKARQANADATKQIETLQAQLLQTYGSIDKIRAIGGAAGEALAAAWGDKSQAGLVHFQGLLDAFTKQQATLNDAMTAYGLTWKDLGESARQSHVDDVATKLQDTFMALTGSGMEVGKVVKLMAGDLNTLLGDAATTGTQIPPSLQPIIDTLVEMGLVTDDTAKKMLGLGSDASSAAEAAGYKTTAELQAVADKDKSIYDEMVTSGEYSASELTKAWTAYMDALHATGSVDDLKTAANDAGVALSQMWTTGAAGGDKVQTSFAGIFKSGTYTIDQLKKAWDDYAKAEEASLVGASQQVQDSVKTLNTEYGNLMQSVGQEAPEEVMGSIETQQRARMAEIDAEKKTLIGNMGDLSDTAMQTTQDEAQALRDAIDGIFKKPFMPEVDWPTPPDWVLHGATPPETPPTEAQHAAGALVTRPEVASIGEGGEPELVGPVGFMASALAGALRLAGETYGGLGPARSVLGSDAGTGGIGSALLKMTLDLTVNSPLALDGKEIFRNQAKVKLEMDRLMGVA